MTKVVRRGASPVRKSEPWPSLVITPRVTDDGRVANHASGPAGALWEEALGRWVQVAAESLDYEEHQIMAGEVKGLVVGLSALTCLTVDEVYDKLNVLARR